MKNPCSALRGLLAGHDTIIAPCAFDALSAKAIEHAGFQLAGTTGQGLHGTILGAPDNGLLTFSEMVGACGKMADAVQIPILADAEGGYGSAVSVIRTVREFEKAGVAGIFIEDQRLPPNCPFIKAAETISIQEMCGKIRAAVDTRENPDFLIVARTDAPFDEAVERAQAYLEAGADMIKPIPKGRRELELWPQKLDAPLHVGFMTGPGCDVNSGLTAWDIGAMGYKIVTFPLNMLFLYAKSCMKYLETVMRTGTDVSLTGDMMSFQEYQHFIGIEQYLQQQRKYAPDSEEVK